MMFNLIDSMNNGIREIAETVGKFYLGNRRGQAFVLGLATALRKSAKVRQKHEEAGTHIPPFLIASIAASCNLRCSGCYARAGGGCVDGDAPQLTPEEWKRVFAQAADLGVSFILLAGGEPLLRRDVIEIAAQLDHMIFPIFTNGTMVDDSYLTLLDDNRNLIPVLSIEGDDAQTDARRGAGVSARVTRAAQALKERGILYGASITVTTENYMLVTRPDFVQGLREQGCGLIFYVEYVPAQEDTGDLVLHDGQLAALAERIECLRQDKANRGVTLLSFPGDEAEMGGCLAAGRGFFHINAAGGAEPCPFSPYSEMNLKEHTLLDVLQSPFFERVRGLGAAQALNHKGGCTLFQIEGAVREAVGEIL